MAHMSNDHRCTVVIPVYNNAEQLPLTLPALLSQAVPGDWQVSLSLADDGSTDSSVKLARQLCASSSWPYRIAQSAHTGAAHARNLALANSDSAVVLLLGADIVLRPGSLKAHLDFHDRYPDVRDAALGFVVWDSRIRPTPFMEWMAHGGSQNNFDDLLGQSNADPNHFFYGSHLSLKKSILPPIPFLSDFGLYGWEDIDLGRRLAEQKHLRLTVLPSAIGSHYHYYSAEKIIHLQKTIGSSFHLFQSNHPLVSVPKASTFLHWAKYKTLYYCGILWILSQITKMISQKYSIPLIYKLAIDSNFWYGFHQTYPQK